MSVIIDRHLAMITITSSYSFGFCVGRQSHALQHGNHKDPNLLKTQITIKGLPR